MKNSWVWKGASVAALALVAGCSSPEIVDSTPPAEVAPPPPPAAPYVPPRPATGRIETTELLGGPAPAPVAAPAPPVVVTMKPIPNPENMSRAERARVYGSAAPRRPAPARPPVVTSSRPVPNPPMASAPGPVSRPATPVVKPATPKPATPSVATAKPAAPAPKPAAKPAPAATPAKPAPVAAAKPAAPAAKPAPAVRETPKPANTAQVTTKAPAAAPVPAPQAKAPEAKAPAAKPAKPKTKPEQLGLAVASDVTGASKLTLPPELGEGKQGVVSLTLAPTLSDRITAEAAKLGLSREARTVDARATLSGKGYTVIPSASQSARLKAGEATTFNWQVTPVEGAERGPLKADVSGDLKGGAKPQPFAIAAIEDSPAPPPVAEKKGFDLSGLKNIFKPKTDTAETAPAAALDAAAPAEASTGFIDKLSLPGMKNVDLPGVGSVKSGLLVIGSLGFLALIILMAIISRASSRRRAAERRRKFRTMTEFQAETDAYREPVRHSPAPAPEPVPVDHAPVHRHEPAPEPAPIILSDQSAPAHHEGEKRKEDEHA